MSARVKKQKLIDILAPSLEIATIMAVDKDFAEKEILKKGDELIGFFSDPNYGMNFQNLRQMKVEAIKLAIEDLATGGTTLRSSTVGLSFTNGKIVTYIVPFGSKPEGTSIFNINLKNLFAFKNWRNDSKLEIPQDDLNVAVYRLAYEWSKLMK